LIVAALILQLYNPSFYLRFTSNPMTQVNVSPNSDELPTRLADFVMKLSNEAIEQHGKFHIAISGGSLPGLLAAKLRSPPLSTQVQWTKWIVWFVDERHVALDHNDSNFKEAKKLFDFVPIPKENIRTASVALPVEECARDYQQQLSKEFPSDPMPSLDLILLGMGPDGHTASLFPNHALLNENIKWVAHIVDSPKPPPQRITLTLPVINAGKYVAFVATGDSKKEILAKILEDDSVAWGTLPAKLVNPISKKLMWFIDSDAAKLLKKSSL